MNENDYAIVIGISQYPHLKPPAPGTCYDLLGPDRDAKAVFDWLTDPAKGGLPKDNAVLFTSQDFLPFDVESMFGEPLVRAKPDEKVMSGCFGWLLRKFQESNKVHLGRRLYVYFSGHGFAVKDCEGGVYDPQASPNDLRHFYVRSWFDWFYENAVFEEFVLWVDACSDNIPIGSAIGGARLPATKSGSAAAGKRFVAFAAKHTLKSVERENESGEVCGVFTTALLKGLNGAAVDQATGRITSESLQRYLRSGMQDFLAAPDRDNPNIDKQPAFGPVEDIDFGAHTAAEFGTRLQFDPRHTGETATIFDNRQIQVAQAVVDDPPWTVDLPSGFYAVKVSDTVKLFEISGGQSHAIVVD